MRKILHVEFMAHDKLIIVYSVVVRSDSPSTDVKIKRGTTGVKKVYSPGALIQQIEQSSELVLRKMNSISKVG